MKICTKCDEEKPLDAFYNRKRSRDGKESACKACKHKPPKERDPVAVFWGKVIKGADCWIWQGSTISGGYGNFRVRGGHMLVHRFSWELEHGMSIVGKLDVCHHCDNPPCVNPAHLFLASHKSNMLDAAKKGRLASRLNSNDVKEIRKLLTDSSLFQRQIGKRYGVSRHVISHIKTGKTWRWVK